MPTIDDSGVRIHKATVDPGIGVVTEISCSGARTLYVAEMVSLGTGAGEISLALGKQGEFFNASPGDFLGPFRAIREIRLRNNTAFAKSVTLWTHDDPAFKAYNTARGL